MDLFVQISLIIVLTTIIAGLMRLIKQPLIIGHIITGLIIGPHFLNLLYDTQSIEIFSKIGISILLFIVGISLSPKIIKDVGKTSVTIGICQVMFTTVAGFILSLAFGYGIVASLYIAVALTFSSTIIVLKLISDKRDTEKLYARIAVGLLLVQDVIATLLLIFVSTFSGGGNVWMLIVLTLLKGILIAGALFVVSLKILPKLEDFFANSKNTCFCLVLGGG
jgi:Kef-type K+ transport system membrane component KefB